MWKLIDRKNKKILVTLICLRYRILQYLFKTRGETKLAISMFFKNFLRYHKLFFYQKYHLRFNVGSCFSDTKDSLDRSFGSCAICESSRPRGGKRQTAEWNRNSIFPSLVIPVRCARISLVKPSHDYANSAIIYFSFTLPFLSYPPLRRSLAQTSPPNHHHPQLSPVPCELPRGSSNFEVRRVFDVATNCSCLVLHAKQWITH